MLAVFFYGLAKGKLSNITIGWDADQNGCGFSEGYEEYGYLYWNTPPEDYEAFKNLEVSALKKAMTNLMEKGVCVKSCPKEAWDPVECKPTEYMKSNSKCDITTCKCDMLADGANIPFEYDTMAIGLQGTGFCVPINTGGVDESSAVSDVITKMIDSFK